MRRLIVGTLVALGFVSFLAVVGPLIKLATDHQPPVPPPKRAVSLTLDAGKIHQTIVGWGGAHSFDETPVRFPRHHYLFDLVFKELKTDFLWIHVPYTFEPRNDDRDPDHYNWSAFDFEADADYWHELRDARRRGARIMAVPFSPPVWMKDNRAPGTGAVRRRYYSELAEYMAAVVLVAKQRYGVDIEYFSPQNEPEMAGPAAALYSGAALRDLIKIVGRKFAKEGIGTRIVLSESGTPHSFVNQVMPALKDGEARSYLSALSYHQYNDRQSNLRLMVPFLRRIRDISGAHGLQNFQTSVHTQDDQRLSARDWRDAIAQAKLVQFALEEADSSAFMVWNLIVSNPEYGVVARDIAGGKYVIQPSYFTLKHYFNYVRPGDKRVEVKSSYEGLKATAFTGRGRVTIVAFNQSAYAVTSRITLKDVRPGARLRGVESHEGARMRHLPAASLRGTAFSYRFKPLSLVTLIID